MNREQINKNESIAIFSNDRIKNTEIIFRMATDALLLNKRIAFIAEQMEGEEIISKLLPVLRTLAIPPVSSPSFIIIYDSFQVFQEDAQINQINDRDIVFCDLTYSYDENNKENNIKEQIDMLNKYCKKEGINYIYTFTNKELIKEEYSFNKIIKA